MKKPLAILFVTLLCAAAGLMGLAAPTTAAEGKQMRLVVLGDSLVAGYDLSQEDAFPSQLEQVLHDRGYDVQVINAGVSGDTSTGGLSRLKWAVGDGTDLVIVELGANDALRGVPPGNTETALRTIITRLQEQGIAVLLAGMRAPPNMGPDFEAEFNAIYPKLARELEVPLYPFFLDGVAANPDLNLDDGMHPNAQGVAEIVERIRPMVEAMIIDISATGGT